MRSCSPLDALGCGLGRGGVVEAGAGGQVDRLEHGVDGPADGGAVAALLPGRLVEVDAAAWPGRARRRPGRARRRGPRSGRRPAGAGRPGRPAPARPVRWPERARDAGRWRSGSPLRPPRREVGAVGSGRGARRAGRPRRWGDGERCRDPPHRPARRGRAWSGDAARPGAARRSGGRRGGGTRPGDLSPGCRRRRAAGAARTRRAARRAPWWPRTPG